MNEKYPVGYKAIIEFYGNPSKGGKLDQEWAAENLVTMDLPKGMVFRLAWDTSQKLTKFQVHKKCKDSMFAAWQDVWNHIRLEQKAKVPGKDTAYYDEACRKEMTRLGLDLFGGCFNFRAIRGRKQLSTHAFGMAIDIDPEHNPLGATKGSLPMWVVKIFKSHGAMWGGDYKNRKDWQHIQFCSGY